MLAFSDLVYLLIAFLLGSVPFSYLVGKSVAGRDVRALGSGNPGATNVLRIAGMAPGLLALFLDMGKGAIAVWASSKWHELDLTESSLAKLMALAALAVVVGHVFSPFLGLKGGKGVATAFGAFGVLALRATLLGVLLFLLLVLWKRYVSLGSIVSVPAVPLFWLLLAAAGWERVPSGTELTAGAAVSLLVMLRHGKNIRRLRSGQESRLGGSRKNRSAARA